MSHQLLVSAIRLSVNHLIVHIVHWWLDILVWNVDLSGSLLLTHVLCTEARRTLVNHMGVWLVWSMVMLMVTRGTWAYTYTTTSMMMIFLWSLVRFRWCVQLLLLWLCWCWDRMISWNRTAWGFILSWGLESVTIMWRYIIVLCHNCSSQYFIRYIEMLTF
jgi:hypothetical protein